MPGDELLFEIEPICAAYEDAWQKDPDPPSLAAYLTGTSGDIARLLFDELLAIDLEYRTKRGLSRDREQISRAFPDHRDLVEKRFASLPVAGRLDDYAIECEIGRGGMGVVYRARQISLDREVALKLLPPHVSSSPAAVERFRRESQAAARLHHGNIVPVFEAGESNGSFFFAMQLVQGESLDALRRRAREPKSKGSPGERGEPTTGSDSSLRWSVDPDFLDHVETDPSRFFRSVARVGLQIAEALAHAHLRGVLHRDVKPANLLLDRQGVVWITDFGLARIDRSDLTLSGELVGTLRYMSPERLHGQCDERADVYGLGATLYELATRRALFEGVEHVALADVVEHREPVAPRILDPRIPRDLETITLKALAKEPGSRYPTAESIAEDLRRFLEGRAIRARRVSAIERTVRWARRHRALATALGAVSFLLISIAIGASIAASRFKTQADDNTRLARSESDLRRVADERTRAAARNLYVAQMNLAAGAAQSDGGFDVLRGFVEPWAHPEDLSFDPRGWEWWLFASMVEPRDTLEVGTACDSVSLHPTSNLVAIATAQAVVWDRSKGAGRSAWTTLRIQGHARDIAFSPDGSYVACIADDGAVVFSVAANGSFEEVRRFAHGTNPGTLAWSPDGRRIALHSSNVARLSLFDAASGELVATTEDGLGTDAARVSFSPSGRYLATGGEKGAVLVLDANSLRILHSLKGHAPPLYATSFSPDDRLASGGVDPVVRIWDPATGTLLGELEGHEKRITGLAWSRTGLLASSSWDFTVRVWNAKRRTELARLRGPRGYVSNVAWSEGESEIVASSWDGSVTVLPVRGNAIRQLRDLETTADVLEPAISFVEAEHILYGNGEGFTALVSLRSEELGVPSTRVDVSGAHASRSFDGRFLATFEDESIFIRDAQSLRLERRISISGVRGRRELEWSPTSNRIGFCDAAGFSMLDVDDPASRIATFSTPTPATSISWSNDGQLVAIGNHALLHMLDVTEGLVEIARAERPYRISSLAWSPDDSHLVVGETGIETAILAVPSLETVGKLHGHTHNVTAVAWHPDGARIATAASDGRVRIFDSATGDAMVAFPVPHDVLELKWSPHGGVLAAITSRAVLQLWDARKYPSTDR